MTKQFLGPIPSMTSIACLQHNYQLLGVFFFTIRIAYALLAVEYKYKQYKIRHNETLSQTIHQFT